MTIPSWPFDSLSLLLAQSLIDNRPPSSFFRSPPAHWIAWQNNRRISLAASNWMLEILPRSDAWEGLDKLARLRVEAELVVFIEEEVRAKRWSPEQMPDVRRPVPSLPFLNWLHLRAENGQRPRMSHTVGLEVKKLAERYGFSVPRGHTKLLGREHLLACASPFDPS
ncbi:hypothetical protein JCM11251_004587 [Rhodosporidiobolus azoricus]